MTLWLFATTENGCAKLSEEIGYRVVSLRYGFFMLKIYRNAVVSQFAILLATTHHAAYYKLNSWFRDG